MEILKKKIRMMFEKCSVVTQVTLDEDSNVPDSQPDVERIIQKSAVVKVEDIRTSTDRVSITGALQVKVLYLADTTEHQLQRLNMTLPFAETQMLEGCSGEEGVHVQWDIEDVTVKLINSRKLSVRALLVFTSALKEAREATAAVEVLGVPELSVQQRTLELLQPVTQKRDVLRVKEELSVPSNKPDIADILWGNLELRGTDIRIKEGAFDVRGELFVFVLYEGEDEGKSRQWMETALPFQMRVECELCSAEQIAQIGVKLAESSVEVGADEDGERRRIMLEAVLNLDIKLYQEEQVSIVEDVYTPVRELVPVREEQTCESLLMKNTSRIRSTERIRLDSRQPRILQICSSQGAVRIDDTKMTEKGIRVEGAVLVNTLYVTADDLIPYAVMEGAVPFSQIIEAEGITENCRYDIHTELEQLSVNMTDSEEIEVKSSVSLSAFVVRVRREACIVEIEEREQDLKKLQEIPGIVGYVVQPEDTLWKIARTYYTTPDRICSLNQIKETDLQPGMGLILLKTVNGGD
ncbi:MAG: DUF3794 domain-containing protein [Eubacteriales bacterium]|nr:DUF3794 domain-containing protein [Eubacteriales bacterium]